MGGRGAAAVQCSPSLLVKPAPTTFAHQGWSHTGLQVPTPGPSSPLQQPWDPQGSQGPGLLLLLSLSLLFGAAYVVACLAAFATAIRKKSWKYEKLDKHVGVALAPQIKTHKPYY